MKLVTRRDFIRQSILTAGALAASSLPVLAASQKKLKQKGPPKKVIVIGAGLAGLSAAYELTQAGHDVSILEAQLRPGGRVLTLRAPFADGLYAEAGATEVSSNHDFTLKYLKLFDIPLDPSPPSKLGTISFLRGKRIKELKGVKHEIPFNLTPEEKALGGMIWPKYLPASVFQEIGNPCAPDWSVGALKKYDQMSYTEFLRSQGASSEAIAYLTSGGSWEGADRISALSYLVDMADERETKNSSRIRGGSDLLPKAFATRLAEKIRYGSPVVKIEQDERGVRVVFSQAGEHQTMSGDYLICAIPFSVLRQIEISPRFSTEKQTAIEHLPYRSVARVFLQSRRNIWLDEGLDGEAWTDLPIGNLSTMHSSQPGSRGILISYMAGPHARRVIGMNESERVALTLEQVEKVYPGIRENCEGGVSKSWDEDPWARGASSWYKPGQMSELWPHIARAEGRVHFAGDHTSTYNRWMQGALQSGNRAAREVNEAPW